ncbi:FMN-binding negative transcriptional regulator [Sphingomonas immobilis]|uniref:FMN-binding negative transcriptional regulator n=1 Tax=Sphingomonas immobilis TaxID=3063997 RepID=A0ABT9A5M8_9SPHN|nr:FMN-binding negative transcriptional regulator [Sphingomonas sp. CA1-15]MDO7844669.1 FMN-binding negative transcriptional regulator [Sphingomonas sp. CA1-15]
MHPNTSLHWQDRDAMRAFVAELAFGALFAATPDGPRVAHLPVVWLDDATLGLHVARGNGITRHLDGATGLFVAQGPDGYVSPDWYGLGDGEVPTWNYVTVELEGRMRKMEHDALVAQIEQLSAEQEARLAPKAPWTRDKMDPSAFEKMTRGIIGFRLEVQAWRGTLKLGQNKPEAVRLAAADGVEASGRKGIAHWMRSL